MNENNSREAAIARYRALGMPEAFLESVADLDAVSFVEALTEERKRKLTVGLALIQLHIPDELRFELLTNHLDETERLVNESFLELTAKVACVVAGSVADEKKALSGGVRLSMLMNILGFDDATLHGVLTDPSINRQAGLIAMTGLNDMGQKIQQLYDEKKNEPT